MSQAPTPSPYGSQPSQFAANRPATNGLGIAGFVVSLVAFLTCGVLSPISLLLSLFALMKRPRGFAIAGTLLSVLGVGVLVVAIGVLVTTLQKGGQAVAAIAKEGQTQVSIATAASAIEQHRFQNSALPDDDVGQQLIVELKDGFGNGLHYERLNDGEFEIRSAGADGTFHTADDRTNENINAHIESSDDADPFGDE